MKTKIIILGIIGMLLSSCGAQTATQVVEVGTEISVTESPATPEPAPSAPVATPEPVVVLTQEPIAQEPIATEPPTEAPTESQPACMTLLEPINGIDLPVTGKVTFSWTPMDEAGSYVLNFLLPSGYTASFETDQTFRNRYMEAFASGGEYQWQVIARGADGSEICFSDMFAFDKSAYQESKRNHNDDGNSGGEETPPPPELPTSTSEG
jgi:hypothetical protein